MKLRSSILAGYALACIAFGAAAPAFAKDLPDGGLTREDVMNWLRGKGYEVTIKYDDVAKNNYVDTTSKGVNWSVYFYGCDDGARCRSVQYAAGWSGVDISDSTLGTWNRVKRFIRCYRATGGSIYGEYDIDVIPGGTWEALDKSLDRWESQVVSFKEMLDAGNSWANGK